MIAGKRYQDFMKEEGYSFIDDQKFIGKLFLRYMAENEDFHDHVEEKEMSWADDFHISNSMIQKMCIRDRFSGALMVSFLPFSKEISACLNSGAAVTYSGCAGVTG